MAVSALFIVTIDGIACFAIGIYLFSWFPDTILSVNIFGGNTMNKYRLLSIAFAIAGCCYIAGIINHILNTGESILSSALLAAGCLCWAFAFYKKGKNNNTDKK